MRFNHRVRFYVTKEQYELIRQMARARGLPMTAFSREVILAQNFPLEKMVREIHRKIMGE